MKELIDQLKAEGLTEEQAFRAVEIIKNFAKEKFPIFGGVFLGIQCFALAMLRILCQSDHN